MSEKYLKDLLESVDENADKKTYNEEDFGDI